MHSSARIAVGGLFIALLLVGMPDRAQAQVQVTAPSGVDIFVIAAKPKVRVATVGTDGTANVAANATAPGTELQVVIVRCAGTMSIVLIERGRTDPDCENAPAGEQPRCNCDPSGVFIVWGRDTAITVSQSGQVTLGGGQTTTAGGGFGDIGWIVDIDVARASQADADNNCDGLKQGLGAEGFNVACTSDGTVRAFSADVGVTFARFFAVKVGYLSLGQVTIDATATRPPVTFTADGHFGSARGVTVVGAVRVTAAGPVVVFVEGGVWRWSAASGSRLEVRVNNQLEASEDLAQDNSSVDPIAGAGVEYWFTPRIGVSGGVRVAWLGAKSTGPEGDVDKRFTVLFVGLKLGWR